MSIIPAKTFREMTVGEVLQSVEIAMEVLKDKIDEFEPKDLTYLTAIIEDFCSILRLYISTKVKQP
jgi:hypothetical protein